MKKSYLLKSMLLIIILSIGSINLFAANYSAIYETETREKNDTPPSANIVTAIGTAAVDLRPSHIDLSTATSESAVLVTLSGYDVDTTVRYRLYNGSNQYYCWDAVKNQYITSSSYPNGPAAIGDVSAGTTFWIMFQRGSNNNTVASYRDRVDGITSINNTASLPVATSIETSFTLSGTFTGVDEFDNTVKYVVLAFADDLLISATSTSLNDGAFTVVCPEGITIDNIEIRTADNISVLSVTGDWSETTTIGNIPETPEDQVGTPAISPNSGNYYSPLEVTITSSTQDAVIYYTLDGTEPTVSSTVYNEPFTIETTTVVKAFAIKEGLDNSNITTATYTFPEVTEVENIMAFKEANTTTNTTPYKITGDVTFVYRNGYYLYIEDESAALLIYDENGIISSQYQEGDIISGGIIGTYYRYSNLIELIPLVNTAPSTTNDGPVTPLELTIAQIEADFISYDAKLVKITDVVFETGSFVPGTASNITFYQGEDEMECRSTFKNLNMNITEGFNADVTGLLSLYNTTIQISPRDNEDIEEITPEEAFIAIVSPSEDAEYTTEESFNIEFSIINFNIGTDGNLKIEGDFLEIIELENPYYCTTDEMITAFSAMDIQLPAGDYSITATLVDMDNADFDPVVAATATIHVVDAPEPFSGYIIDFETETKTSWASADIALGSPTPLNWNMTDVLIGGDLPADWKNGLKSARLRGYTTSALTMLENKPNGIGNITFQYRQYGTESQIEWNVDWSSDGDAWSTIGTITATAEVQTFSYDLNQPNARIRIVANTTNTSNRRMNVDDIMITDFSSADHVAMPLFSPPSGNYFEPFDVTISTNTEDAIIYYTTDESEPTPLSTLYSEPIAITTTTVLKAIAVKEGMESSDVATGTYTFPVEVANIRAFKEASSATNNTPYKITGDVTFVFRSGRNIYVEDATGGLSIYDYATPIIATQYVEGDVISGGVIGTYDLYNGLEEMIPLMNTTPSTLNNGAITPTEATIAQIKADYSTYESRLVKIADVVFAAGAFNTANSTSVNFVQGEENMDCRNSFRTLEMTIAAGLNANVYGFPAKSGDYYNLLPRSNDDIEEIIPEEAFIIANPISLSGFTYVVDEGPSAEQSFMIRAGNFSGNIIVTAPVHYEVSLSSGEEFSAASPLIIPITDEIETAVYVRLMAGLEIGEYEDEEIIISATDINDVMITLSGSVTDGTVIGGGMETFDNLTLTGSSYASGTFLGQDGSDWTYEKCRGDVAITGKAIMLGRNQTPISQVESGTIAGGVGILNFDYMQAFSTGVNLNVFVNDVLVGNVTATGEANVPKNSGDIVVNIAGSFTLKFINVNSSDGQVVIDNVSWTGYVASTTQVMTPVISPNGGIYYESIEVNMTCETSDAEIRYTLDGSEPDETSEIFVLPFTVSTNTTVKSKAFKVGLDESFVATATYTFPIEVANIRAFKEANTATNSTPYKITGDLTFVFRNGANMYVQDATGGLLIYDNSPVITTQYEEGDVISGGIIGTYTLYNGLAEFIPLLNTSAASSNTGSIIPASATIAEIEADYLTYESRLTKIEDVIFEAGTFTTTGSATNINFTQGEETIACRNTFRTLEMTIEAGFNANVTGFPNAYNTTYQISPRANADIEEYVEPRVATPSFSPIAGTYYEPQLVTIICATEDATIYYTTDGSTPSDASSIYTNPIAVASNMTIKAFAVKENLLDSEIAEAIYEIDYNPAIVVTTPVEGATYFTTESFQPDISVENFNLGDHGYLKLAGSLLTLLSYSDPLYITSPAELDMLNATDISLPADSYTLTLSIVDLNYDELIPQVVVVRNFSFIVPTVEDPQFSVPGGTYSSIQHVALTCATENATIYYTIDGSDPTTSSSVYTTPIEINTTTTLKAIAAKTDWNNSAVVEATYTIVIDQSEIIYSTGFEDHEGFEASTVYNNTTINYQGETEEQWGTYYGTPSTTSPLFGDQSMQMRWYHTASDNVGYTFTNFDLANVTRVVFYAANTNGLNVKVSYSTDGGALFQGDQIFTLSSSAVQYQYDISESGEHDNVRLRFMISLPSTPPTSTSRIYIDSVVVYGITGVEPTTVSTPNINPSSGNYYDPQQVTINCATTGATIRYTIDGSEPTTSSTIYSAPFQVSATTTVKAKAWKDGLNPSNIATATYSFPVEVPNIQAFKDANSTTNGTVYKITGDVTFVYRSENNNMFVQDATGGLLIYDNVPIITTSYTEGDVITGGIYGTYTLYNGLAELVPTRNTAPSTTNTGPVAPTEVTIEQILTDYDVFESRLVKLIDVTFTEEHTFNTSTSTTVIISQDDDQMGCRNNFKTLTLTVSQGYHANITGFPSKYNTDFQIAPRYNDDIQPYTAPGTVATPIFNPGGGNYTGSVTVTITTATEDAKIYYTTDGSTPDESSTLYTSPVTLTATCTLKAIAYKDGMTKSDIAQATYNIGVGIEEVATIAVSLYPNPAQNLLIVEQSGWKADLIEIFTMNGQIVCSISNPESKQQIDLQNFSEGIYMVRISSNEAVLVRKFVKQ